MSDNQIEKVTVVSLERSAKELFTTMIGIDVSSSDTTDDQSIIRKDITGMIGIVGEYKGIVTVYFPEAVAFKVVAAMMGMEITELDSDAKDALGEITNIIVGGAKNFMYEAGFKCEISTPTVVVGKNYHVYCGSGVKKTIIPFSTPHGPFFIDFFLKKAE
jgi:chemotaxis protein CheX